LAAGCLAQGIGLGSLLLRALHEGDLFERRSFLCAVADFTVDAFRGRPFIGKVSQIRNAAQAVSNVVTYIVVIDVNHQDQPLRPGMTANVTLEVAKRSDALLIPAAALRFKPRLSEIAKGGEDKGEGRRHGGDGGGSEEGKRGRWCSGDGESYGEGWRKRREQRQAEAKPQA
jgi:multidrug efflux pump subunit AcrA (membrane-fusion protein)